jgi:hypothetical protein
MPPAWCPTVFQNFMKKIWSGGISLRVGFHEDALWWKNILRQKQFRNPSFRPDCGLVI